MKKDSGAFSTPGRFEELFREYFQQLTYFAVKFTRDEDSAREIVQNVFLRIWENRDDINLDIPVRSYLYTSVQNRCLNWIRDRSKFHPEDASAVEYLDSLSVSEGTGIEEIELEARINSAISGLPERCREVFRLNRFEGKKYAEIAELLGISVKTVEAQVSKALRLLRGELSDWLTIALLLFLLNCYRVIWI